MPSRSARVNELIPILESQQTRLDETEQEHQALSRQREQLHAVRPAGWLGCLPLSMAALS